MGTIQSASGQVDLAFRLERALTDRAIEGLPSCEGGESLYGLEEMVSVNALCPEVRPTPRVIHALEAESGRCRWRTIIHETSSCARPSLQHLNLVDVDQDGPS